VGIYILKFSKICSFWSTILCGTPASIYSVR